MSEFFLDKRLAAIGVHALDLPLSRVLVMDDARFPWLILVPRRPHLVELFDLDPAERPLLMEEIAMAGSQLKALTKCHKTNIANLGNAVPQLHIHVIARNPGDAAWPGPVWGKGEAVPYEPQALEEFVRNVVNMF
jgi:diadenosine tetraphosphate (Ap4A) HIT family hydrolase